MYGINIVEPRPNRFSEDIDIASPDYHVKMARYCVGSGFNEQHNGWIGQYNTNLRFFLGDQWWLREDVEAFLKDTSQQSRNRIKVVRNFILPTVAQYIGNAKVLDITVRAASLSTKARTRRESKLEEMLLLTDIANQAPDQIAEGLRDKFGMGKTKKETESIFHNLWQDNYVDCINGLLKYVAEQNNFKRMQGELGMYLCLSGLCCMRYREWNGDFRWELVPSESFFWDRSARLSDLSDSEFMGTCDILLSSEIFEKWNLNTGDKKIIEQSIQNATQTNNTYISDGKLPVYDVYWKDSLSYKHAYVMDEYGYPQFVRIDHKEEGEEKPKFTKEDIIPYKDLNTTQRAVINGRNSKGQKDVSEKWVDLIRFCTLIPKEVLGNTAGKDMVLDYGIMPYQDTNYYKFASCKFPFKVGTWYHTNGYVYTPINELINPQRIINRYESVKEQIVNSSKPSMPIYDKTYLPDGGEFELLSNWDQGKATGFEAKGMGINNMVSVTPATLNLNSVRGYDELAESMRITMNLITGVNESLLGQSQGSEQLVGVTQLQIQRGSLIQEPFYSALVSVFEQAYQSTADVGKRIYADNERDLAIAVGDDNVDIIRITKNMKLEDFRIFIHREADLEKQKAAANDMLLKFAEAGLLDKKAIADLGGRSVPADIWSSLRKQVAVESVAATMQAPVIQKQEEAAAAAQQGAIDQANEQQIEDRNVKLADIAAKKGSVENAAKTGAMAKIITKQMEIENQGSQTKK